MTLEEKAAKFVKDHGRDAVRIQEATGLNAAFILTHAALESGWGEHAPGNMFFGVKAGRSWKGLRQLLRTWEATKDGKLNLQPGAYTIRVYAPGEDGNPFGDRYYAHRIMDWFRAYATPYDSFLDHADLLQNDRYKEAWAVRNDPMKCIRAAMAAGYGTDPAYVGKFEKVLGHIKQAAGEISKHSGNFGWIAALALALGVAAATVTGIVTYRKVKKQQQWKSNASLKAA